MAHIRERDAKAVIPPRRNQTKQRSYDRNLYADRSKFERLLVELNTEVATHYSKTASSYLAMVHVAVIRI
jgi:transposase